MRQFTNAQLCTDLKALMSTFCSLCLLSLFFISQSHAQCVPAPNSISGTAFLDSDYNGEQSATEQGQANVLVTIYDADGNAAGSAVTGTNGFYSVGDLTEGEDYQVVFAHNTGLQDGFMGTSSRSAVQYEQSPACDVSFGLLAASSSCGTDPQFVAACFVQGPVDSNSELETLVALDYAFGNNSPVEKYASHGETGSIWGVAWKETTSEIFSSAFVKMHSGLKSSPYSIFKTSGAAGSRSTVEYANISTLLETPLAGLGLTDIDDCAYGTQVGRVGLGNLVISPDQSKLYVTVLDNNTLVSISADNPSAATTNTYQVPTPAGLAANREFRIFALSHYEGKIYVGATITAAETRKASDSKFVVYTFDPATEVFEEIFTTDYTKGYWQDAAPSAYVHGHWLTDIEFADEGYMMLGITDRVGHRYCKPSSGSRVDQQFPDLLGVWFNAATGQWTLEANGVIDNLAGSGVGNGEGPNGGEFFGFDFWPTDPDYHSETALGSVLVIPGTGAVVATVYDPLDDSYSAGVHRYRTGDGALLGAKQLYSDNTSLFGKATGFGDMAGLCQPSNIEIGNFVWFDSNSNGVQNAGEAGIQNVPLNLYNADCIKIASTFTDADGYYSFNNSNVAAGVFPNTTYWVEVDESIYSATSGVFTVDGSEYSLCKAGNGSDDALDCDAVIVGNPCLQGAFIEVNVGTTNHSFDIGFAPPAGFDLALTKTIVGKRLIKKGELVVFNVTVINQGGQTADRIGVIDYIPSGFTFDETENLNWIRSGDYVKTYFDVNLGPNEDVSRLLRLRAVANPSVDHLNYAEIFEAIGLDGLPASDVDSTPDEVLGNDNGGVADSDTDDFVDGTGTDDEDDHDPALPAVFDLAIKVVLDDDKDYFSGEVVKFTIDIYNQGNTNASSYAITQYADEGLEFLAAENPDWVLVDGNPTLIIDTELESGATAEYCLYYKLAEGLTAPELASYSEISSSIPVGFTESFDFDSSPDAQNDNDNGAEAYTNSDNFLQGNGDEDEDDHDIVIVRSRHTDLALIKTVQNKRTKPGANVTFDITVINQGTQEVDQIEIVDYLPEGLTLADANWTMLSDSKATTTITLEDPLQQGESVSVAITTKVADDAETHRLVNIAEILKVYSRGVDISEKDIDSTPDDDNTNDPGGHVEDETDDATTLSRLIDEDDMDPAEVLLIASYLDDQVCLNNSTDANDGQYRDDFVIEGPTGDSWYISFSENYFLSTSPAPPAAPTPLVTGLLGNAVITELVNGDGTSFYTVSLVKVQGQPVKVAFRNQNDDIETFEFPASNYIPLVIDGETALCGGDATLYTYTVSPQASNTFTWSLPSGGTFVGGVNTGTSVQVDWSGVAPAQSYQLQVAGDLGCTAVGTTTVAVGETSGAMFCIGNMNMSLDSDCSITVTPQMVLSGGAPAGTAYSVMLLNHSGEVIPNATLTSDQIGQTVTAKVIDGCSGNSCWSSIFVEDKIKPTITCETTEIFCNKVDEYSGPFVQDNCGGNVTMTMLQDLYLPTFNCDPDYLGTFTRQYQATDEQGNKSEICDIEVKVKRVALADMIFPADTTVTCNGFEEDENGNPSPWVTGRPHYKNEYVWPNDDNGLCNIIADYQDVLLPGNGGTLGGVIKVLRTWTVYEWCSNPLDTSYTQLIKIRDITPPVITQCPQDLTVSATGGNCEATFAVPLPVAMDECQTTPLSITTNYPGGAILNGGDRVITLPYRATPYEFTYTVADDAGLVAMCMSKISVVDDVTPVVVCDAHTIVGLNGLGQGYLYAANLDDGSYDACGIDRMEVQRMDAAGVCGNANNAPADRVFFCCEDLNRENMVQLIVWDVAGNSNSCMVNVEVQDKQAPTITDLPNREVECGSELFPLSQFGTPDFTDACGAVLTIDSTVSISLCGTGTIIRRFTASDTEGSASSTQIITVVNNDPFTAADIVSLPENFDVSGMCDANALHPDSLTGTKARPVVNEDQCDMVGFAFEDDIYPFGQGDNTCFKIVRTWTISDWCQENTFDDIIHVQIIKVQNFEKPTIVTAPIDTVVTQSCEKAAVSLSATGSDDCSSGVDLKWTAKIYFDQLGVPEDTFDIIRIGTGGNASVMDSVPLGTHFVQWTYRDACGNVESALQEFTVISNTKPVLTCVDLTVGLGPMDLDNDGDFDAEMACFHVDTILNLTMGSTFHPCGIPFELSLSPDAIVKKDTFGCNDLGINVITAYAIDIFGNVQDCTFEIDVQDNNTFDICIDVKDCVNIPMGAPLDADEDCEAQVTNTDFDVIQLSDSCGTLTITHDYSVAGDAGYDGTNDNTTLNGAIFPIGETTVTFNITNGPMSATCDVVIVVTDNTAPELTCILSAIFEDTADGVNDCQHTLTIASLDPEVTDNCDDDPQLTHDYDVAGDAGYTGTNDNTTLVGAVFPVGTTDVTWTVVDADTNSETCVTQVIVTDNVAPMLMCDGDVLEFRDDDDNVVDCGYTVIAPGIGFTATDLCEGTITATHTYPGTVNNTDLTGGTFPVGDTDVVFTATDGSGNSSTCTVTIRVGDDNPPVITCPADISAMPSMNMGVCSFILTTTEGDATAVDPCDGPNSPLVVTHNYSVAGDAGYTGTNDDSTLEGAVFEESTTVLWTATQGGQSMSCEVEIILMDNTAPMLTCPDDITVDADANCEFLQVDALDPTLASSCNMSAVTLTHDYAVVGDAGYAGTNSNMTLAGAVFSKGTTTVLWTATNVEGGLTDTCSVEITVNDVTPPVLTCDGNEYTFDVSDDGNTDCVFTMDSDSIMFTGLDNCDGIITATHNYPGTTTNTSLAGGVFSLDTTIVTFTVTDGAGLSASCDITIIVTKSTAPVIVCAADVTVNDATDGTLNCDHTIVGTGSDATASNTCPPVSITHDYAAAPSNTTLDGATFEKGITVVTWTVTDLSGLTATCPVTIEVIDQTGPPCVDQDTVIVNIDASGVYFFSVADLSSPLVDNCDGTALMYSFLPDSVTCDQAGTTFMVPFIAIDSSGNSSPGCPLFVTVNDSDTPECNPIDITVNLDEDGEVVITPSDVNNIGMSACGVLPMVEISDTLFRCNDVGDNEVTITVFNDDDTLTCIAIVTVVDTLFGPVLTCDPEMSSLGCEDLESIYGGSVLAWMNDTNGYSIEDNCPESPTNMYTIDTTFVFASNACSFGVSTRTFTVTDQFGMVGQCVQFFTVEEPINPLTQEDIDGLNIPDSVLITDCIDPALLVPNNTNLGQITVDSLIGLGDCFDVTITFNDVITGMGCEQTITRTWTIVDACSGDVFTFVQIIEIIDMTAPILTGPLTYTASATTPNCSAFVSFAGLGVSDCNAFTATNNSMDADDQTIFNPAGTYAAGQYSIDIMMVDACGNESTQTISLNVIDTSDFLIICNKFFVNIEDDLDTTGIAVPSDYYNITGGCNNDGSNLQFTFTFGDLTDTARFYTCADVDTAVLADQLYWYDLDGNFVDSCLIFTRVTDTDNLCPPGLVGGTIFDELGAGVPNFEVNLQGAGAMSESTEEGSYAFPTMALGGQYEIVPSKDGDDRLGVNTLDLIKIQRHLLSISMLSSPYKLIAADITNDERVTPADLLALRRLLHGIDNSYGNNSSWRAVDAAHIFPDALDPWLGGFPESYQINALNGIMDVDFIGVKIGDVDNSAMIDLKETETRSASTTTYNVNAKSVDSEVSVVTVTADTDHEFYGMQLGINCAATIASVETDLAGVEVSFHETSANRYTVIVTAPQGFSLEEGQALLQIAVEEAMFDAGDITIDDKMITSEVYLDAALEVSKVIFDSNNQNEESATDQAFELMQNKPNPWSGSTSVVFSIPTSDKVELRVFDLNGKQVLSRAEVYDAGTHTIQISNRQLPVAGIYYYQLSYKSDTKQMKMIRID